MPAAARVNLAELNLPEPLPACYTDEAEFSRSLELKAAPQPCDGLYPRDGTATVTEVEEALSELTIPEQRLNVVTASGMAAVTGAVLFSLREQGQKHREAPTLVYSRDLYSQSGGFFVDLGNIGVRTRTFDAAETRYLEKVGEGESPQVIFAETVANTPAMPVLDLYALLGKVREQGDDGPIVVLDNTLPMSTSLKLESILRSDDRVLVVESATKSAMHNSEHLGVVYSPNQDLIDGFRKYKARLGAVTSTGADPLILARLEDGRLSFHERNRAAYESTGKIAVALAEAQQELDDGNPEFMVTFPTLPSHPNYQYAQEHFPEGFSPVVFMSARTQAGAARSLLKRMVEHPRIREQVKEGQIFMRQSFGFKEAAILYDPDASYVRVAGGYGIDSDALADALKEAAADV